MSKVYFTAQGQGTSMQPIINQKDKLYVEKVKQQDLRVGDVVVFYNKKKLVGHRVVEIKGRQIITKGDNVPMLDKPQISREIFGKVVKIEGKYGTFNLNSKFSKIITKYFLFYSLATYYLPLWLRSFLVRVLKGRKILIRLISLANFSK